MEFTGTFKLDDVTVEEVWFALSDPVMIKQSLPGCQFLVRVEDDEIDFDAIREQTGELEDPPTLPEASPDDIAERTLEEDGRYAALIELGVGNIKPSFETVVAIDERAFPVMEASGEGSASSSSFEMTSGMSLTETDDGVQVEWHAEANVFGRVAQMGQRVINPVANRVVNRFFNQVAGRLRDVSDDDDSSALRDRIWNLV